MWILNTDTGKWIEQSDTLSKDNYDRIKQDLQSIKLYSKCLSGSTYLPINRLEHIYESLSYKEIGFYISDVYSAISYPSSGPAIPLNSTNSEKFYRKYLTENAFTVKNLFTPTKLIDDQQKNYLTVDVATTEPISNIGSVSIGLSIDGITLKEGHRVLIKDQITEVILPISTDPDTYFTTIELVSNYYKIEDLVTQVTYYFYNEQNGIYVYKNNRLFKEDDMDLYESAYRYSVSIKLGDENRDRQFHLLRLKGGYYPIVNENKEFSEKHNWVLRNRVDYHNIFDINYFDIIHHSEQYLNIDSLTYSIPARTIAVGDFGVIIDNQDKLTISATFSISHIISNKYKVTMNSICEVDLYYWSCGNDGTLLKISKLDFHIEKYELNETSNLMSISFFGKLNGIVVGKFNTIYCTIDGGYNWKKVVYPEFDIYSFNKVLQYDFTKAYIGGEAGVFIELMYTNNTWIAYKRKVSKELTPTDEYILVEDINDIYRTNWTSISSSTYSFDPSIENFASNLVYNYGLSDGYQNLTISIDSKYFGDPTFSISEFYLALNISNSNGTLYNNLNYTYSVGPLPVYNTFDIYQSATGSNTSFTFTFILPLDVDGNLYNDTYTISSNLIYNYDITGGTASILPGYIIDGHTFDVTSRNGNILLMSTNNDNIICYDMDNTISVHPNRFLYLGTSQSHSDIKSIIRRKNSTEIYISGDKIYRLDIRDFTNIGNTQSNLLSGQSFPVFNLFVNKLFSGPNAMYLAGNNSLLKVFDYNSITYKFQAFFQVLNAAFADHMSYGDTASLNNGYFGPISDTHYYHGIYTADGQSRWANRSIGDMFRCQFMYNDTGLSGLSNRGINEIGGFGATTSEAFNYWKGQFAEHCRYELQQRGVESEVTVEEFLTIDISIYKKIFVYVTVKTSDPYLSFLRVNSVVGSPKVGLHTNEFLIPNGAPVGNWKISDISPEPAIFDSIHITPGLTSGVTQSLNDLDPTFLDGLHSRMLFMDYDMASKLNFFDSNRQYRLPDSITFSSSFNQYGPLSLPSYLEVKSHTNEYSWIDYYKDSIKTFQYYTSISDSNVVRFSSTFSYVKESTVYSFSSSDITNDKSLISQIAPSINSSTASRFIQGSTPISAIFVGTYSLYLHRYMVIIKRPLSDTAEVSDILKLTSDVVDSELMINRIEEISGDRYLYCYSEYNDAIINGLKKTTSTVLIENLNKYKNKSELISRFNLHPVSIGYKLIDNDDEIEIQARFNNKTAYYNMQADVNFYPYSLSMMYKESFLNFGYSPMYNILNYLSMINSSIFIPSKRFVILPRYYNLPGNDSNTFESNNIYIEVNTSTNKLIFGSDFKFHWESLLIETFVDITTYDITDNQLNSRMLILKKYYDSSLDGYVMEFHKKIEIPNFGVGIVSLDIVSRNTLQEISDDLQLLNNIQRTSTVKTVEYLQTFTNLENELKYKYSTDSYTKALSSDYDIKNHISAIIYSDYNNQIAMNVLNIDSEMKYNIIDTTDSGGNLQLTIDGIHNLKIGDGVVLIFTGGTSSSQILNTSYFGYQTVIGITNDYQFVTSKDFGVNINVNDIGYAIHSNRDPFFNYQPIDIFNLGDDLEVTRSVEITPENFVLNGSIYSLINLDLNKYKFQFVDGLSLTEVNRKFSWLLEAEISNAVIGRDNDGPIWYSGTWKCGRWFGGTWISGKWVSGDWYDGTWKSYNVKYNIISAQVDTSYVDDSISKWYGGRWFGGTWSGGTWYDGRRYGGSWIRGNWYNGIWNDGYWKSGTFQGGIWVIGTWEKGTFNCNSKPSYWLDGKFMSGDFENGIWYNGNFGNKDGNLTRFGIKSTNSRTSTWNSGRWVNGEFHSQLNIDDQTGLPTISDVHKYSIWKTGIWFSGDWYGGISYNIDFKSGNWHGGILEEIQVIGVSKLIPAISSSNEIIINGIFKFNIGDDIWIIDNYTNGAYSPIGSNDVPMKYRINKITEDIDNSQTYLSLNYNLSSLGVTTSVASFTNSNYDTGLRVVSYFKDSNWESGIWTNGIFDGEKFKSGIWYNGIFVSGIWGE